MAGRMARKLLASVVADDLLDKIVEGDIGPALPTEAELCERYDVSRMTVREALKTLQAQNVVAVLAGRGAYVNPIEEWRGIEAILRATSRMSSQEDTSVQLVEVRRMIETGAAALAAARRTDAEVDRLTELLAGMRAAHDGGDLAGFVEADIAFHDTILKATRNPFVGVLFDPLARVMRDKREQTSAVREIQAHAIDHHAAVLAAVRSGDGERARVAMDDHMTQTTDDLRHFILDV